MFEFKPDILMGLSCKLQTQDGGSEQILSHADDARTHAQTHARTFYLAIWLSIETLVCQK